MFTRRVINLDAVEVESLIRFRPKEEPIVVEFVRAKFSVEEEEKNLRQ